MDTLATIAAAHHAPVTVERYHQMIDAGVLTERDRVELIEGVIVAVSPQSPEHLFAISRLTKALNLALGDEWVVRGQGPLTLARSEPEPDIAVVRADLEASAVRHPRTATLVVEVAKTSLSMDRAMAAIYAEAGVAEYWIVDVERRLVEVHRELRDGAYAATFVAASGDTITLTELQVSVAVASLYRATAH